MEDILEIYVTIDTRVVELGTCDAEHISMIVLLHTLFEKETGSAEVPSDEYLEKKEVSSDTELLEVFRSFSEHKETKNMLKMPYIPVPLATSSSDIPNPQPRFMTDLNEVDFSEFEETIFYGDGENDDVGENEHVGADELGDQIDLGVDLGGDYGVDLGAESDEMGGVPNFKKLAVIPEVPESVCGMPYEIGNNDLFEGYQSNSEDEFFSDSDNKRDDSKLTLVTKSIPFKKLVGAPIRFEVGQTHDSVYTLRELLTDYAIQERFSFKKIKNDKNRLSWACLTEKCLWRLHASIVGDETTMQVMTYNNEHTYHRIYKSQEARSKWIASKFKILVRNNPSIQCGVISDLLRD
ncbi:hypothetical protein Ddye_014140 [Dipteronia dyeriana]|uniref:Transposase MuDR plant domain-containing protein n=1 Tax=Dipteronia dyeriana TaxID=168575 RepID=A0AAD9X7M4_9ROSI|nr:hypothetical protein Ddye_014140 [Dipteronia dyeriana]